jgi:hypothetical protein
MVNRLVFLGGFSKKSIISISMPFFAKMHTIANADSILIVHSIQYVFYKDSTMINIDEVKKAFFKIVFLRKDRFLQIF